VTIFETDLAAVEPNDLATVKVDYTITDGRVVYEAISKRMPSNAVT
jgi:predicted amidohydrolase YtcJ